MSWFILAEPVIPILPEKLQHSLQPAFLEFTQHSPLSRGRLHRWKERWGGILADDNETVGEQTNMTFGLILTHSIVANGGCLG